jgi:polysaccharide pyruvyl transferase WcaK-like protein
METVKVYSPVEDKKIRETLGDSPIFKGLRYHSDELSIAKEKHAVLYEYSFKFDGTKLVQFTGMKKL